jgi:hypothetical protein
MEKTMSRLSAHFFPAVLVAFIAISPSAALAQDEEGQTPQPDATEEMMEAEGQEAAAAMEAEALTASTLTSRSHTIPANSNANFLEGTACGAGFRMMSGACHPGFHHQVIITNQFPNTGANTWRCGFRNNTSTSRTVWIYTLCGR